MQELVAAIPDVDTLLQLEPEELGAKLLFIIRGRRQTQFHPGNLKNDLEVLCQNTGAYPVNRLPEVILALSEAFGWLLAQGLIVDAPASNGWRVFSRRARKFEDENDFADYAAARHLPKKESLHDRLRGRAWNAFMRGEFDVAVFQAMKAVEIEVRRASGIRLLGKDLMRAAFHPETGPLTDLGADAGERQGRSDLFAGAIASFKNPASHRDVDFDHPIEAAEVVMLANHLLRIVDTRRTARAATP